MKVRYDPKTYEAETFKTDAPPETGRMNQGFTGKQTLQLEKTISEVHEITKLHKHDTTSSYNEFPRYVQPYKLIPTKSTTHPVNNASQNLY